MKPVPLRNTKYDTVKAAIAYDIVGKDDQAARAYVMARWQGGAPPSINKASDALDVGDLDTSSVALADREMFGSVRERALLFALNPRRTAFRTRSITVSNAVAGFVDEASPIPLVKPSITNAGLVPAKIAGMAAYTEEALTAAPGIEAQIFDDLVKAYSDALDFAMFDPSNDGSGAAPKSLTNGAPTVSATSNLDEDLAEVFAAFEGDLGSAVWVTTPQIGAGLSDAFSGRDIGARGGELAGIPVLVSSAVPDARLTLVDPRTMLAAWDDFIELRVSSHGTVEMAESPSQNPPTGHAQVSLWQNNLKAARVVGRVAWVAAGASPITLTGLFPNAT